MRKLSLFLLLGAGATVASAQVAEISVSGGVHRYRGNPIVDLGAGNGTVDIGGDFRFGIRFTLNTYRFFGHEFGYGYSRSHLSITGSPDTGVPVHSGFYDFLVYATPEGSRIRPFLAGGVQFSSFFPPGTSVYYGNQITKFGFNYGGGLKFTLTGPFGARIDLRQYNMGKPDFGFPQAPSGRLMDTEVTVGFSFNL